MAATPMEEGRLAALNKEPRSSNPYKEDTQPHDFTEWNEGFDDGSPGGEDDDLDGE